MRMEKMADIRDEHGNPIQLTDEHGNPVVLTDEHGNPMWLTGVATKAGTTLRSLMLGGSGDEGGGHGDGEPKLQPPQHEEHEDGGSTSSSEEDEQQSEERKKGEKKKGLAQKIKEKLVGGKHKEEHPHSPPNPTTMATKTASPTTADQSTEHVKKGATERIDVKMPSSGHLTH